LNTSVDIKAFTVGEIEGLLSDKNFWELDPLPITKQRIISKMRNPRASKGDLALVVAFESGRVVGYRGVFPDAVFINGSPINVLCASSTWVAPARRRQGIPAEFTNVLRKAYDGMIYSSEMSEAARRSTEKSNLFTFLTPMKNHQLGVRISVRDRLPKRISRIRHLAPLLSGFDRLANVPVKAGLFLWRASNKLGDKFRVEYISEIDHETARFIDKHQENNLVRRGAAELNWITRYPWVIQAPFPDVSTPKFFFSTVAKSFSYTQFRVLGPKGEIRAFVMLRLRDGQLQVPYVYFDRSDVDIVARLLCHHMIELRALKFETCNAALVGQIKKVKFPIVNISVRDRHTRISNELARGADLDAISLQDGDGDKALT
jgi:hypothetical protein